VTMPTGAESLSFPRVSATCDFLRPVRFDDLLDIAIEIERVGSKSVSYAFTFTHEGALVAKGRITAVCCRMQPGVLALEAVEIPEAIRARLLAEESEAGG
jgi:acyl-CoA thioester hydrolase